MSTPSTSRTFEAVRKVRDRLESSPLPSGTTVGFVDVDVDAVYDYIQVSADVEESNITWARMPGGRDEDFDVRIVARTLAHTEDAALDRLEDMADAVQDAFLDSTTGLLIPLDIAQQVKLEGVDSVAFSIVPFEDGRYRGEAVVRYRMAFRI